jgi:hypothetical protein
MEPHPVPSAKPPPPAGPEQMVDPAPPVDRRPRPLIERIGLALVALVMAALFAVVGLTSFLGGEPFLGMMGVIGCLMVLWVGGLTLFRG